MNVHIMQTYHRFEPCLSSFTPKNSYVALTLIVGKEDIKA